MPVDDERVESDPAVTDGPADAIDEASLKSAKIDRWLTIGTWVAVVGLLVVGGWFGYSIWLQQQIERATSPAYIIIDAAQAAVQKTPNDAGLRVQLARALGAAGKFDEAKTQLNTSIKLMKDNPDAYQALGEIAILQKEYDKAEAAFKKLLDMTAEGDAAQYATLNQRREFAFYQLGEIALLRKRYDVAVNYLKEALRTRRDASDTYVRLAQAYVGLDEPALAVKQLNIALQYDPQFAEAHFELGKIYLKDGRRADAAWEFRRAIDGAPEERGPQDSLASIGTYAEWFKKAKDAAAGEDLKTAIEAVDIARAMDPKSFEAAMLSGQLLERTSDLSGAVDAFKAALELEPENKDAQAALARVEKAVKAESTKGKK